MADRRPVPPFDTANEDDTVENVEGLVLTDVTVNGSPATTKAVAAGR